MCLFVDVCVFACVVLSFCILSVCLYICVRDCLSCTIYTSVLFVCVFACLCYAFLSLCVCLSVCVFVCACFGIYVYNSLWACSIVCVCFLN